MPIDIDDMCRTCMSDASVKMEKEKQMVPLDSTFIEIPDEGQNISVMEVLRTSIPQLQLEQNEKLPKCICLECANKLKELHQFQQICLKVEQQFIEMLETPAPAVPKSDDEDSLLDIFENELEEGDKFLKAELEEDVFVDENSFQSDQFKDENVSEDILEVNEDDFIESCSDLSIDFVLDADSDSDYDRYCLHIITKNTRNHIDLPQLQFSGISTI